MTEQAANVRGLIEYIAKALVDAGKGPGRAGDSAPAAPAAGGGGAASAVSGSSGSVTVFEALTVIGIALLWVYMRRNAAFTRFRNTILLANGLGLIGYRDGKPVLTPAVAQLTAVVRASKVELAVQLGVAGGAAALGGDAAAGDPSAGPVTGDDDLDIVGVYHSHTHTEPYPSPTDVAQAPDPEWHYAIVSLIVPMTRVSGSQPRRNRCSRWWHRVSSWNTS